VDPSGFANVSSNQMPSPEPTGIWLAIGRLLFGYQTQEEQDEAFLDYEGKGKGHAMRL